MLCDERAMTSLTKPADADSPDGRARAMIRAAAMLQRMPANDDARRVLESGAAALATLLDGPRRPDWAWFEIVLGDDACRLPEALIRAGIALGSRRTLELGLETLDWILDQDCCPSEALADACDAAYAATRDARWSLHAGRERRATLRSRIPPPAMAREAAA